MLGELLSLNVFHFMLVFVRVGTAMTVMPGFSSQYIPVNIQLAFALALSFAALPAVSHTLPSIPYHVPDLVLLVLWEALIGAFFGTVGRVLIAALHVAGTLTSFYASLANALIMDPIAEQQSATLSTFLGLMGLVMVFVTDTHHLMLLALIDSYTLFAPGLAPPVGDFTEIIARGVSKSFAIGVQMAAPFMVVALTYYVGLGLLSRLMPSLQVFFIGMPLQISTQIAVLAISLPAIMMVFMRYFQDGFDVFLAP